MGAKLASFQGHNIRPKVDVSREFSKQGIRLSFLIELLYQFPYEDIKHFTTRDVCEQFIKPVTKPYACTFCEYQQCIDRSVLGDANVFISHTWQSNFVKMMEALVKYFKNNPTVIIWLDIFCHNQHQGSTVDFFWWNNSFTAAINQIGQTVMVLIPWTNPIPLSRSWCLWELYCTIEKKCNFSIALTQTDENQLLSELDENPREVVQKLQSLINSAKSECSQELERNMIHDAIQKSIGFSNLNEQIFQIVMEWMMENYFQEHLQRIETDCDSLKTINTGHNLGELYILQKKYEEAEALFSESYEKRKGLLGEDHRDTLASMHYLGLVYYHLRVYRAAKDLLLDCYERRKVLVGADHPETLESMNLLALLYEKLAKVDSAKSLLTECYEKRKSSCGPDHPQTVQTMIDLASFHERLKQYDEAIQLQVQVLIQQKQTHGMDHIDTLASMHALGMCYYKQGNYEKAEHMLLECVERKEGVLGIYHYSTIQSRSILQEIYKQMRVKLQMIPVTLTIIYESELVKVGSFIPTLKKRWFRFTSDQIIRYFTDSSCTVLKGSFEWSDLIECSELKKGNWFEWVMKKRNIHGGRFRLQCESREIYDHWSGVLFPQGGEGEGEASSHTSSSSYYPSNER